jgi:CRP/FNR family transcriptional regulator
MDGKPNAPYTDYPTRLLFLPRGTERLEKLGPPKVFRKNHIIIKPGETARYCYVVKSGRVIAFEYTAGGGERVYNFMEEHSLFLEANLLMDAPSPVYFKTAAVSELICIGKGSLLSAMSCDAELSRDVVESVAMKFLSSMDQLRQAACHGAAWKICNLLLIFAARFGAPYDGKILIKEKLSQQMMANLIGANRVTTARVIKELKDMSLVEQVNGYYCVRDAERLRYHLEYIW